MLQGFLPERLSLTEHSRFRLSCCVFLALAAPGCGLDGSGTYAPSAGAPSPTSSSSSGTGSGGQGSTGQAGGGQGNAGQGGGGQGGQGGAGGGTTADLPKTCMDVLQLDPGAASGTYTVDPDGSGGNAPFDVTCKMLASKAWTLVGLEAPNDTENLKFLGVERGSPADLIAKKSALVGVRFRGLYSAARIEWDQSRYVEFQVGGSEIFDDTVDLALPITQVVTGEGNLGGWVSSGAKFCRAASQSGNKLPGDTSWAVKPSYDMNDVCGCNSMGWAGQGAFYSGTGSGCTSCACHTGGFVGVKDNGAAKSATVNWETRIYVR